MLNLDLYSEHMPGERITGSKIDLSLSAGSTYTQVYTVSKVLSLILLMKYNLISVCVCVCVYLN